MHQPTHSIAAAGNTIAIGPSRWLAVWIVMSGLGACVLTLVYLPGVAGMAIGAAALWFAWRALRLHALQFDSQAIVAVRANTDGLGLALKNGMWIHGAVRGGGLVTRWLAVLRVQDQASHRTRTLLLLPERLQPEDFRRLRVYLRWALHQGESRDSV